MARRLEPKQFQPGGDEVIGRRSRELSCCHCFWQRCIVVSGGFFTSCSVNVITSISGSLTFAFPELWIRLQSNSMADTCLCWAAAGLGVSCHWHLHEAGHPAILSMNRYPVRSKSRKKAPGFPLQISSTLKYLLRHLTIFSSGDFLTCLWFI